MCNLLRIYFMPKIFLFFLTLLLFSCIKEVDYDIPPMKQQVVVNGLFCPDSTFKIHISLSSSTSVSPNFVENATVEIFKDNVSIGLLYHTLNGWYETGVKPMVGKSYKLKVSVPNFDAVEAISSVPILPSILSSTYYTTSNVLDNSESGGISSKFPTDTKIIFKDDPNQLNYYEIGENRFMYEQTRETDLSILSDSELDFNPRTYFFSDLLFNGSVKNLILRKGGYAEISPWGTFYAQPFYDLKFKICSHEYYSFRKSWTKHVFNQNSELNLNDPLTLVFLGDPIEMYTNVKNGLGVFAGYNQTILTVNYVE